MKNIIFTIMVGFFLVSCSDFLSRYPEDKIASEDFFRNEREINLYANSFYQKAMPGDGIAKSDGVSDITAVVSVSNYLTSGYTSQDQGGWSWSILTNINYFISRVEKSPVSRELKDKYIGLARFWRAMFYFDKVKQFGGVPYYDFYLDADSEELYAPRNTRIEVMEKVLEDVNFAVDNLDEENSSTRTIVTKNVALALKARLCLFEGTFRKYHNEMNLPDAAKWLELAADAATMIIETGEYSLHNTGNPDSDYRDLFVATERSGVSEISKEIIWAQVYDTELLRWHDVTWKYNSATYGSRWSLTRPFVNSYLNVDGSRFTDKENYDEVPFAQECANRDKRLKQTVRTPGFTRLNGVKALPDFSVTLTGYQIMKWCLDDPYFDGRKEATNAMPIFRYAEILLILAESKAELGEFNSTVWNQTIRPLRQRAGVNPIEPVVADNFLTDTFYPGITDKYLLEIRRERAIEFIAENVRYYDLIRWKLASQLDARNSKWTGIYVPELGKPFDIDNDGKLDVCFYLGSCPAKIENVKYYPLNDNISVTDLVNKKGNLVWGQNFVREWNDKKYLRPIPYSVMVVNPNIEQNPQW